ncbi:uncharacterized protein LOC120354659 [Nilaparvata lugens]|uniref:uncharacterized protein LOC120354658 n=1 Tax=Nilaparvata lugens TaxID=108931 RepID=UPI00193E8686|nr:uncharacterized protein LOC120354658 [Nilaparvata lugens]XP_039297976.1 uncharacterized protein LOC120354659 [Nilaparvata lugens]
MRPIGVNEKHEQLLLDKIAENRRKLRQKLTTKVVVPNFYPGHWQKIEPGDRVRISKYKMIFDKGYLLNWTNELFTVTRVRPTLPVTYELEDYHKQPIKGGFYAEELLKTTVPEVFEIDKVIKRQGNKLLVGKVMIIVIILGSIVLI